MTADQTADVLAVIPTTAWSEPLARAVLSTQGQTAGAVTAVVVHDGPPDDDLEEKVRRLGGDVLCTGRRAGANAARNLGWRGRDSRFVAFLDADDFWLPDHVRSLKGALDVGGRVSFGRSLVLSPSGATVAPTRLPDPGERIGDYLFIRRRLRSDQARAQTSTLFTTRETLEAVPFDESLTRHQDWDWLLRVEHCFGTGSVVACPDVVSAYERRGGASLSATGCWQTSATWLGSVESSLSSRAAADFAFAVVAATGAKERSWASLQAALCYAGRASWRALAVTAGLWGQALLDTASGRLSRG